MNPGPIIIIEDDPDDQDIIRQLLEEIATGAELQFFSDAASAFTYISRKDVVPFIILSDINIPIMNGFQLRDKIHEDHELRMKCIPYIFVTTGGESNAIMEAYSKNAQGFFIKPNTIDGWKQMLLNTVNYWMDSKKPRPAVK